MRITEQQKQAIKDSFYKIFEVGDLFLFGSRVDDDKKGGDIDLYIKVNNAEQRLFKKKIAFLVDIKNKIGDRKIDIVLEPFAPETLKQEIEKTGVLICRR